MSQSPEGIARRTFLELAGSAALALSLGHLGLRVPKARASVSKALAYKSWEDVYRQRWAWDRVARNTHNVNCAYQRACCWNVYVKEGIVWREEQAADYPQTNPNLPDFNPRGCQKGACYSQRMYDASRVRYPLKRVGARGEGKWRRISWEQALREIADASIDAIASEGPGSIIWDLGTAVTSGCHGIGLTRTVSVLDTPLLETNTEIGDHFPGSATTLGKICYINSFDDLFYSDLILIWGGNPTYTQIPNAHFINEARYHGARVVAITPDLNPSGIHADEWIPVNVGSDAALGLSLAQVIVEEGIHDARFVAEQTDLPFLVRKDTRRFLRAHDLEEGGAEDVFYVFDQATNRIREAPRSSLSLEGIDPALEGEFRVQTREEEVAVTPVFELLRQRLEEYRPEAAAKVTGAPPSLIRKLARAIAGARGATSITQTNFSKFYHGLEMERAQILVFALAGQIGRKGAGVTAFPYLSIAGSDALNMVGGLLPPKLGLAALGLKMAPEMLKLKWQGYSNEMFIYEMARREHAEGRQLATPLFLYLYGGLKELYGSARRYDPWMKRDFQDYLDESLQKGWQTVPRQAPRILFEVGGNLLRRVRGYDRMIEGLLPKLGLLVTLDWRMSNTARYSDYVLPAAGWYEKDDFTWGSPITPFSHVTTRTVEPLGESRSDWEFHCLFLKTMQQRAIEQGTSRRRTPKSSWRRCSRSPQTWAVSAGARSRKRDTRVLRSSA
jgi:DMSO reductase family type II enzyme molybdopterin subunit